MSRATERSVDATDLAALRRGRRAPVRTQFDYLHVRRLVEDIEAALGRISGPIRDVLDVYCGSRPYDDLLPEGARCVGLDVVGNEYGGIADVISDEFLPFEDESFDLVTCYEAFQYVEDPARGVAEIRRVLRPGGTVLVTVPFLWEYNRTILEHRYTEPELVALFDGWDDARVVENGGRVVVWATLTGSMVEWARSSAPDVGAIGVAARALFGSLHVALNCLAPPLARLEERHADSPARFPMNLLLLARKPTYG
jgi:SAM-dependent methyltransferase